MFKIAFVLLVATIVSEAKMDSSIYNTIYSFRECFTKNSSSLCFKEKALEGLNETIMSSNPIVFYEMASIEKNPNYDFNKTEDNLPLETEARSMALSSVLYDKIEEFFKSRTIKFNMVEEGRGKKGGGGGGKGKGGMMMMAIGGMACMVAQLFLGKVAFLAGTALILAKIAIFISGIVALKKLGSGGGGGESSHVVYADHGNNAGSGWHRSLNEAQNMAYRSHLPNDISTNNYGY